MPTFKSVDVSNREQVFEVASRVSSEVGDVSILIQNAGVLVTREMLLQTENEIKKLFDINVLAIVWITQAFLPKMIENDKGHIVGICSVGGIIATRNIVPYCASKFAVRGSMEGISSELYATSNGKSKVSKK
jgi:short-subunit dehydrogenase